MRVRRNGNIKRFTVKYPTEAKNREEAMASFHAWRNKYGYSEPLKWCKVHKESVYIIEYELQTEIKERPM